MSVLGVQEKGTRRRPTLSALASAVGLSKPTVSRALNDYPDISDATKDRVRQAAIELGYIASSRARQLTSGQAEAVGLVTMADNTGLRAAYQSEFANALALGLAQQNFDLLMHCVPSDANELDAYRRIFGEGKVDGFVLMRTRQNDERVEYLLKANIPFVTQGLTEQPEAHAWLDIDVVSSFGQVVDHLAAMGHKHIAFLNGSSTVYSSCLREKGFREGIQRNGLNPSQAPTFAGDFSAASGRLAMRNLRDQAPNVTALVCANDAMAMGAVSQACETGLRVPDDISVTGYDGVRLAELYNPPITTLAHSAADCGQAMASMIVGLIKGDPPSDHQVLLPATLMQRASSAPVAGISA